MSITIVDRHANILLNNTTFDGKLKFKVAKPQNAAKEAKLILNENTALKKFFAYLFFVDAQDQIAHCGLNSTTCKCSEKGYAEFQFNGVSSASNDSMVLFFS